MNNTLIMTDALSAYNTWYLVDIHTRIEMIETALTKHSLCSQAVVQKLTRDTTQAIAEVLLLPGPTGESNELYTQGRGVVLIGDFIENRAEITALVVHLSVALMAGNSVIIATDDEDLKTHIEPLRYEWPQGLLQCVSKEDWMSLLDQSISVVTLVGQTKASAGTFQALAQSTGALVSVVEDDGMLSSPLLNSPLLSYRYITECTRTINVTAVGGNATLLELSS